MRAEHPPLVVEPWLLLADQWEGFTQASQLQGLAVTTDYYFHPLWRISCAGARWWCSDVVCGCPLDLLALGFTGWCRLKSAPTCVLPGVLYLSYKSNLRWLLLQLGLEIPRQRQAMNLS